MLGEAGFSLQSATVRMMFPRVRASKKKETYAIVISSIVENLAPSAMRFPLWWFIFLLNITD
jgi:hypothetical protein